MRRSRRLIRPARRPLRSIFRSRPSSRSTARKFRSGCRLAYWMAKEPSPLPNSSSSGNDSGNRADGFSGSRMEVNGWIKVDRRATRVTPGQLWPFAGTGNAWSAFIGIAIPTSSFPDEQCQRSRVSVQKIALAHRTNFAIAEKSGQTRRPEVTLNQLHVVVRAAEQALPAPVATAKAAAIKGGAFELRFRARQQRQQVFGGSRRVPALKLNGLAETGQCADREGTGARVRAEQVANQEIAALKFLDILVDNQTHEQVSLRLLPVRYGEFIEGFH